MRPHIESQISARRAALKDLDRQMLTIQAELRAYEEVLAHLDTQEPAQKINSNAVQKAVERGSPIPTEMTPGWSKILIRINEQGRSFGAQDLVEAGESVGAPTKILNARSQLFQWEKKHLIARVKKGKYKLAPKGLETIRKIEGPNASASEPS
jgi:hypothetical protein